MKRRLRIGTLVLMLWMPFLALSQELNCQVQINSQQIAINDNTVFEAMQRSVYEFMN